MEEKILEIQKILKAWLQNKEDIVFTDDIAISEISEEIFELFKGVYTEEFVVWYKSQSIFACIILDGKRVWFKLDESSTREPEYLNFPQVYQFYFDNVKDK